jgi:peptidoglycan/xylan/chitin deacetylase (PgdA/CDA1 family)
MVLNYHGMLPEYRSVNAGPLPGDAAMADYRGVITAFTGKGPRDPRACLGWLLRQMEAGRKLIVLGSLGVRAGDDPDVATLHDAVYRRLGLRYEGDYTAIRSLIRYVRKDPAGMGFERPLPPFPEVYERFAPAGEGLHVFLSVERTDRPGSESAVVVTGPAGGFALLEYMRWQDPVTFKKQWYLNPFLFFREALGLASAPAPDPTTLNGLRVAISHVDGDAFSGISRVDDDQPRCGEVIRDRVLERFDFPVTVSVITGEVDPAALGSEDLEELARDIFALPNVEPASHSYSHPYYWDPDYTGRSRYHRLHGIEIPGYTFDPAVEIDGSVDYINRELAPPDKPCRVFLWTGNCEPRASDLARCDRLGLLNMNGGDTVFDDLADSYTGVAPYYRNVEGEVQVHSGQANENILTNLWQGPFHGYRSIVTTMERTGFPRRVAPIDIYYHFYSAEYPASLQALQDVYTWVLEQETARLFTSQYLEMVRGYLDADLYEVGPARWEVRDYGACTTVRFEDPSRKVDLERSENVLGWVREPQGLYVSLVPGRERAVVQLASDAGPPVPHVRKAGGRVERFEREEDRLLLQYRGYGRGMIQIGGLEPGRIHTVSGSALGMDPIRVRAGTDGTLTLSALFTGTLEIAW